MKHDRFAELAARELERMAASHDDRAEEQMLDVSKARAHELRVAVHVVRDLSRAATRKERRRSEGPPEEKVSVGPWTTSRRKRVEQDRNPKRARKSA